MLWLRAHVANATGVVLIMMLAQDESDGSGAKKAKLAKAHTLRPAAAAAASKLSATTHDELDEYDRRVDITASLLVLNREALSLDGSVKKLMPREAALLGGLGGMEGGAKEKAMKKVENERARLEKAMQSVCWETPSAAGSASAGSSAWALNASPPAQSPTAPVPPRVLERLDKVRKVSKAKSRSLRRGRTRGG